ncbi:MAG: hypothetical protein L0Y71_03715, partial [Gemmataceae bacterium]|nr:hypothetical protein [Gemmataceae bacterium]
ARDRRKHATQHPGLCREQSDVWRGIGESMPPNTDATRRVGVGGSPARVDRRGHNGQASRLPCAENPADFAVCHLH